MSDIVTHINTAQKKRDIDGVDFAIRRSKDTLIIVKRGKHRTHTVYLDLDEQQLVREALK